MNETLIERLRVAALEQRDGVEAPGPWHEPDLGELLEEAADALEHLYVQRAKYRAAIADAKYLLTDIEAIALAAITRVPR